MTTKKRKTKSIPAKTPQLRLNAKCDNLLSHEVHWALMRLIYRDELKADLDALWGRLSQKSRDEIAEKFPLQTEGIRGTSAHISMIFVGLINDGVCGYLVSVSDEALVDSHKALSQIAN